MRQVTSTSSPPAPWVSVEGAVSLLAGAVLPSYCPSGFLSLQIEILLLNPTPPPPPTSNGYLDPQEWGKDNCS